MENLIKIDTSTNLYTFDYLNCFEKPLGLVISRFGEMHQDIFYLYLKMLQSYNIQMFGKDNIVYTMDFNRAVKWLLEDKLNLKAISSEINASEIYSIIKDQIDKNNPVLITGNLRELSYTKHYKQNDWGHLFLINGYDDSKELYSIIDGEHKKAENDIFEYGQFTLEYDHLEKLYNSMKKAYGFAFIGIIEKNEQQRTVDCFELIKDCLELFLNGVEQQPYKEIGYIEQIANFISGNEIKKETATNYDPTNQIDFVFTRGIKYKNAFLTEMTKLCEPYVKNKELIEELVREKEKLIAAWNKILSICLISYNLKSKFNLKDKLDTAIAAEEKIRELILKLKLDMEQNYKGQKCCEGEAVPEIAVKEKQYQSAEENIFSEIKNIIANICKGILKVDEVCLDEDFFKLGGDSLKAAMFAASIIKELSVEIPIDMFYKGNSLKAIAEYAFNNIGENLYMPIMPTERKEFYPMSPAQKRIYVINRLDNESLAYNISMGAEIDKDISKEEVKTAFLSVINKHEAFRTYFPSVDGLPVQMISETVEFEPECFECVEGEEQKLINSFIRPFDLKQPSLFRVGIIRMSTKSILILDIHHIIADGVSVGIIFKEFADSFNGVNKEQSDIGQQTIQYRDYTMWLKSLIESNKLAEQEKFYIDTFAKGISVLNFPTDYQRPLIQSFEGENVALKADKLLTEKLELMAKEKDATLFMILLGAFYIVLQKYTGQSDITLGIPMSGRTHIDLQQMVGMFVNTVAIRNVCNEDLMLEDFILQLKENVLNTYKNQDYQFDTFVEKLEIQRDMSRNPLFDIMFSLQNMDIDAFELNGKKVKPYEIKNKIARFDITLEARKEDEELYFNFGYCTKLFRHETIEKLGEFYMNILEQICQDSCKKIGDIELCSKAERELLLYQYNRTEAPYSSEKTIHQLFEEQVERTPENVAVTTSLNDKGISYRELNARANQLAWVLRENGLRKGEKVSVIIDRSIEMVIAVMAVLKAGGTYVPLEVYLPDSRIIKILDTVESAYLITNSGQMDKVCGFVAQAKSIKNIICVDNEGCIAHNGCIERIKLIGRTYISGRSKENLPLINSSEDIAYIIFTSGSTGMPKGVVVKHKPVINLIEWVNNSYSVNSDDKLLFITSLSFDLSVYDIFGILSCGASIRLALNSEIVSPQSLINIILEEGITFWDSAPQALQIVRSLFPTAVNNEKSKKLRLVFLSGDWIPVTLPGEVKKTFENAEVIGLGGATEATIWSNYFPVNKVENDWISIPYGKPIQNAKYYVLDSSMNPCPVGLCGDLYIGGECLASGYINDKELTDRKFIKNPFEKTGVIYRTGDLARWMKDGNMEFLGRSDFQVKIRGFRIELGDVESALAKHPEIRETVVVQKKDATGNNCLVAYYVVSNKENDNLSAKELQDFVSAELPGYMVPAFFVELDRMPLTANGKLDRKALPELKAENIEAGTEFERPDTELEIKISDIWKRVLNVQRVGINDNFFNIGGNSIYLIQVNNLLRDSINIDVPVIKMFQLNTIKLLREYITGENKATKQVEKPLIQDSVKTMENKLNLMRGKRS